jgi:hypothetical protein
MTEPESGQEARLRRLEDLEEIRQLFIDYGLLLTSATMPPTPSCSPRTVSSCSAPWAEPRDATRSRP